MGNMVNLMLGDCLEVMNQIPDGSVDMVMCDLPYGTTACKWDSVIPFESLWAQYRRVIKRNGAIVLTASQPFTTALISSNMGMFKYTWIWDKVRPSNFFAAKYQPLNNTEDVCVFSLGGANNGALQPMKYEPQGVLEIKKKVKNSASVGGGVGINKGCGSLYKTEYEQTQKNYPSKIIRQIRDADGIHPTQKPVALMEYLIRTYTNEGDTVLDNTMGSGTTGVACINTGRKFIGIERDAEYFAIAKQRIEAAKLPLLAAA